MSEYFKNEAYYFETAKEKKRRDNKKYPLHIGLFLLTFLTTTMAGVEWTTGKFPPYSIDTLATGLPYSLSILFMISCHEFGHYFAAVIHKVRATLPYYIPFPPIMGFLNFGTMGAVIKTKSPIQSKKVMFDIGVAGPIAGFIACLIILVYGFTHVPGIDYLLKIHPDYLSATKASGGVELAFGDNLLFMILRAIFVHPGQFFPPMTEIYHYPYLCVGWFGLFITAMNMIPVGQLDGGHIAYTMFGEENHNKIATIAFAVLVILGTLGALGLQFESLANYGWMGWLFWALVLFFIIRIKHPTIPDYSKLDNTRMILGYISFAILIVSFTPNPFIVTGM